MAKLGKAHAKLIVIGEHFVVSWNDRHGALHPGSTALALPLPELSTEVRLEAAPERKLVCEASFPETESHEILLEGAISLMEGGVRLAARSFGWDLKEAPLRVASRSNFPISRGLGSSAAFSVALARAFQDLAPSNHDLFAICQELENLFHGKSSGLDTSVVLKDQPVVFRNGSVQSVFRPSAADFVVVDAGPRENCASLVQRTLELRRTAPEHWLSLAKRVDELARGCKSALEDPDGAGDVADAIREAHEILESIGLVTPVPRRILELGLSLGAMAGKVSGAGAGGAMLFVTARGQGALFARRIREAGVTVLTLLPAQTVSLEEQAYAH